MKKYNPLLTLISSVFIVMSVSAYGENPRSPEELEEYITDNAQAIIDAGEDRAALKRQIQQLLEEKKQLKETVDKLAARLEDYAKEQQTKYSEDIAGLQKQITANQGTANTAVTNAKKAQTTADNALSTANYGVYKANTAQSAANEAINWANNDAKSTAANIAVSNTTQKQLFFSKFGTEVEKDTADKHFFFSSRCPEARVMAANIQGQAAICVCLNGEIGKGWYCFN